MPSNKETRKVKAKQSRDSLSDSYIIDLLIKRKSLINKHVLIKKTMLKTSDIIKYPELIECKRIILKINRLIKAHKNGKNS